MPGPSHSQKTVDRWRLIQLAGMATYLMWRETIWGCGFMRSHRSMGKSESMTIVCSIACVLECGFACWQTTRASQRHNMTLTTWSKMAVSLVSGRSIAAGNASFGLYEQRFSADKL